MTTDYIVSMTCLIGLFLGQLFLVFKWWQEERRRRKDEAKRILKIELLKLPAEQRTIESETSNDL